MRRLSHLLKQPAFQCLLSLLGFALYSWPVLSVFDRQPLQSIFSYLFIVWAVLILLLFFTARSCRSDKEAGSA